MNSSPPTCRYPHPLIEVRWAITLPCPHLLTMFSYPVGADVLDIKTSVETDVMDLLRAIEQVVRRVETKQEGLEDRMAQLEARLSDLSTGFGQIAVSNGEVLGRFVSELRNDNNRLDYGSLKVDTFLDLGQVSTLFFVPP